jgi:hypothetical protein
MAKLHKLNFEQPLWDQVSLLSNEEYERVCDKPAIYGDAAYTYDYSIIRLYSSALVNSLTSSSLLLCYLVWAPQALAFWMQATSTQGVNVLHALLGVAAWYMYAYTFHRLHHDSVSTKWAGSYYRRLWHFNGHGYHHICPHDSRRIVIHPLIAAIPLIPHGIFTYLCMTNATLHFQAGLILGHMVVESTHYSVHYFTLLTPYLKALKNHHLSHHYKQPTNLFAYGHKVEDKMWERAIGNLPPKQQAAAVAKPENAAAAG